MEKHSVARLERSFVVGDRIVAKMFAERLGRQGDWLARLARIYGWRKRAPYHRLRTAYRLHSGQIKRKA